MYWIRVRRYGLSFGQKLPLGWVIIGDVCLGKAHKPEVGGVCKTTVLSNGRNSLLVNAFSVCAVVISSNVWRVTRNQII